MMPRDTDIHGDWIKEEERYEDDTKSHLCGKQCEAPEVLALEDYNGRPLVNLIVNDEPQWYQI